MEKIFYRIDFVKERSCTLSFMQFIAYMSFVSFIYVSCIVHGNFFIFYSV